jgi:hypothetical protein
MIDSVTYNGTTSDIEYDKLAPGIFVYRNVIPKEWNAVERIENALAMPGTRFSWKAAKTGYDIVTEDHRKCKDWKIDESILSPRDEYSADIIDLHKDLLDSLKRCIEHYKGLNYLAEISFFECVNVVRYGKGEFFKVHTDDGDPYRCTLSAVGYPNDNYEGGELWFPEFDVKHKPQAGDFVLSPSAYVYAHSSEPVLDDGLKYSFVIMTDRNNLAHRKDSPVYYSVEERSELGLS